MKVKNKLKLRELFDNMDKDVQDAYFDDGYFIFDKINKRMICFTTAKRWIER